MNEKKWDETYKDMDINVPWYSEEIPDFFKKEIEKIKPTKTLDVGCGYGQYANYLSNLDFDVTAVDFSEEAIKKAKEIQNQKIDFICADALNLSKVLDEKFNFIYDISILHHLSLKDKEKYAENVYELLSNDGLYMMCAFDTEDKYFEGKKEFFSDVSNTTMYPVNEEIIREIFGEKFVIQKIEKVNWGKEYDKKRYLAIMTKK